jgi:DivIVA domain-containing protein
MHQGNIAGRSLHDYVVLRDRPGDDSWIEPVQHVAGDAANLAQWAHRAGPARFSRTRLRPGYVVGEVDGFLEAIRDTFLGVRQPPLTADEVRNQKFSTTRLQPGYDEEEVDVFLEELEARLAIRCAECGALVTETTRACAECGAPPVGQRPVAADLPAAGPGNDRQTAPSAAGDDRQPPPQVSPDQLDNMDFLGFWVVVCSISLAWINKVPGGTGLSHALGWVIATCVVVALMSLIFLVRGFSPRSPQQVTWAFVPVLSLSFLAFAPFLWLAVIRRRARDWAVLAVYLAAVAAEIALVSVGYQGSTAWSISYAMIPLVAGTAAIHALVAYRPGAGPTTFREARAATANREHQEPVTDAALESWPQDASPAT